MEAQADSCARTALMQHYTPLLRQSGMDIERDSARRSLAWLLAERLYADCPAYRNYFEALARAEFREEIAPLPRDTGYLLSVRVERSGQRCFRLLGMDDSVQLYLWEREFDGSARFFDGAGQAFLARVEVVWEPVERYDPDLRQYVELRLVRRVEELGPAEQPLGCNPRCRRRWQRELKRTEPGSGKKKVNPPAFPLRRQNRR